MRRLTLTFQPDGRAGYIVSDADSGKTLGDISLQFNPEVIYTFTSTDKSLQTSGTMMIHVFQEIFGRDVDLDFPQLNK